MEMGWRLLDCTGVLSSFMKVARLRKEEWRDGGMAVRCFFRDLFRPSGGVGQV